MRNYIASTIAATGLIIFVFGAECSAQSVKRLVADIPFDFFVGDEKLPGGKYEFEATNQHANAGSMVVRPLVKPSRRSMIISTIAETIKPGESVMLRFNRYGSDYFLARISIDSGQTAFRLRRTSAEEQLAKEHRRAEPVMIRQTVATGR